MAGASTRYMERDYECRDAKGTSPPKELYVLTNRVYSFQDKVIVGDVIAYPQAIEKSVQPNDHSSISNTSKVSSKWHEKFKYAR